MYTYMLVEGCCFERVYWLLCCDPNEWCRLVDYAVLCVSEYGFDRCVCEYDVWLGSSVVVQFGELCFK